MHILCYFALFFRQYFQGSIPLCHTHALLLLVRARKSGQVLSDLALGEELGQLELLDRRSKNTFKLPVEVFLDLGRVHGSHLVISVDCIVNRVLGVTARRHRTYLVVDV